MTDLDIKDLKRLPNIVDVAEHLIEKGTTE
jgi:hypothetical protein